jgi:hypothetical protein
MPILLEVAAMDEDIDSNSAKPAKPPLRSHMRGCFGGLLLILIGAGGLFLWFGWRPKLPVNPVHLTRDANGRLTPSTNDSDASGVHLELNAAAIRASNQLSTTASEGRPGGARLACRRMAIVNNSDHFLMERVGAALLQQLNDLRGFQQVDYYPYGERLPLGDLAPDLMVALKLAEIETSGLPGSRQLHARIVMSATSGPYDYPSHHFDGLDGPLVQLSLRTSLKHDSTTTGVGTPSSRYKLASEDIAKQLGGALTKKLNELYEKEGPLPALPDRFYPAYRQPPHLPLPADARCELIASHHGLMKANESIWRLATNQPLPDVLTGLEKRLKQTDWKTKSVQTAPNSLPHLRMLREEDIVMVYPERKERSSSSGMVAVHKPTAEKANKGPAHRVVFVYFADRMSREERAEVIGELLGSSCPIETLLVLESMMDRPLRERLCQRIEADPPASPRAWLLLARWHEGAKRPEKAKQTLHRAHLLLRTVADDDDIERQVKELAKKLGEQLPRQVIAEPGELEALGFAKLAPGTVTQHELNLDQGALFYTQAGDRLTTFLVRIVQQRGGDKPIYALYHMKASDGNRSWGTGSLDRSSRIDGLGRVHFRAEQIDAAPRFRLSVGIGPE